jgi:hypothetical protein
MNETSTRSSSPKDRFDYAKTGYFFLSVVLIFWMIWLYCLAINPSSDERMLLFNKIVPRSILGIPVNSLVAFFSFVAAILGIIQKVKSGRKWYKTRRSVQVLILLASATLFLTVLQIIF